jgi:hypothetical protein
LRFFTQASEGDEELIEQYLEDNVVMEDGPSETARFLPTGRGTKALMHERKSKMFENL